MFIRGRLVVGILVLGVFVLGIGIFGLAQTKQAYQLTMGTGGTTGSYYPLGGAISQIVASKLGVNITVRSTGGTVENLKLIEQDEAQLGLAQNDLLYYAWNGEEMFKQKTYRKARIIASMYPEYIQIAVREDSGVKTVYDLKGKRINVGAPGSGSEANARQILNSLGIKYEDFNPYFLSNTQAAAQMKNRQLDGMILTTGLPSPAIMDVALQHAVRIIPFAEDDIEKLEKKYPFFKRAVIPAGSYKGQSGDVLTVSVRAMLVCHESLSEDLVYNITKVIWENREELAKIMAKAKYMDPKDPVKGATIPVHPGAKKYYKEIGINVE